MAVQGAHAESLTLEATPASLSSQTAASTVLVESPVSSAPKQRSPLEAFDTARAAYHSGRKTEAVMALQFAAGQGHAGAQWMLGRMYAEGDGIPSDDIKAFEYFREVVRRASASDDSFEDRKNAPYVSSALVWLGSYYLEGIAGSYVKADTAAALRLFTDAASNYGDPNAQYNLARMYLDGNGVKRDPMQAMKWLNLAVKKSHAPSLALLGHMLFTGEGISRQPAKGLLLMAMAREQVEKSGSSAATQWIVELHDKALETASEEDRTAALAGLERLNGKSAN